MRRRTSTNTHSMWERTSNNEGWLISTERIARLLRAALGILSISTRNSQLERMSSDWSAENKLNIEGHFGALSIGSRLTSRRHFNDNPAVSPKTRKASHVNGNG